MSGKQIHTFIYRYIACLIPTPIANRLLTVSFKNEYLVQVFKGMSSNKQAHNRFLLPRRKKQAGIAFLVLAFIAFWFCLPEPLFKSPTSFVVEGSQGELLSAAVAKDGQWRFPAPDSLPLKFEKCILAFEDKNFYRHPGIDPFAIARALKQNSVDKKVISGASTIDMQLIRLATGNRRTYLNKFIEAVRALRLNLRYSKKEILCLYAANAPFGTNVVGLEAASWRYFGREASSLSWGEMASLAVLPNAPSLVHPGKNRQALIRKRNRLIDILRARGILDPTGAKLAKAEPVPDKPFTLPETAPHLLGLVRTDYGKGRIKETRIKSSIDSRLQEQVGIILREHQRRLMANLVKNCAALVLDVETGNAIVYAGNIYEPGNAETESYVDVIQARRSPGSTLKPLLYAAMLNEGMLFPHSLVADVPTQIAGYQPNNYDLGYDGAVPASKALARSLNVPAVKMLQQYRYERFHSFLKQAGISTLTKPADFYGLSLILGGCETSMWELAGLYAGMARTLNRFNKQPGTYLAADWRLPDYHQTMQNEQSGEERLLLNASSIYYTFQAMNEVMRPGEELLWKRFTASQQIAWKTGTSFGFRDAWAIGVTPRFVVAVWAGNTDGEGRPGLTGIDATGPILFDIFRLLPAPPKGWFSKPASELKRLEVCQESGFKASELCTKKSFEDLPPACVRGPACSFHQIVHLDKSGQFQVSTECESPANMLHVSWFVLPPAMEYYYKSRNYSYRSLPPLKPGCNDHSDIQDMELIYPRNNAKIYMPVGLDEQQQEVIFSAAHRSGNQKIHWHLDDEFAGSTREIHQIALRPSPGKHIITLVDEQGKRLQQSFTVLSKQEH